MSRRVMVFGPAYLDRVLVVDQPLGRSAAQPPLDQSVDGIARFTGGSTLELRTPAGDRIVITPPAHWPGPLGQVDIGLDRDMRAAGQGVWKLEGVSARDDLGGMGAGFAAALGGTLHHALGMEEDPTSQAICRLLERERIDHHAVRVAAREADWTLLISSGEHGDKLAVGFRGCHDALAADAFDRSLGSLCDLRVVAGLANAQAARVLAAPGARCRLFAPAMRNMVDRACPVAGFSRHVDILCCNRLEWESLGNRETVACAVSILVVTDGPSGARARVTSPEGQARSLQVPPFPRARPPRDTNRAGEGFAAALVSTLLDSGWNPGTGVVTEDLIRQAMLRASVASALVLDRVEFGFPRKEQIDAAVRAGTIS